MGFAFVCVCTCLSHFVGLCFDALFDFFLFRLYFCFHFFVCMCVLLLLFCFQFSLPITKYFVCLFCLLITGCFCLRSRVYSPQQKCFFFFLVFVWVSSFCCCCCCLLRGWCLFLWPLLMLLCFTSVLVWVCLGVVVYSFSLSFKYLDQRVGFFTAF